MTLHHCLALNMVGSSCLESAGRDKATLISFNVHAAFCEHARVQNQRNWTRMTIITSGGAPWGMSRHPCGMSLAFVEKTLSGLIGYRGRDKSRK